MSAGRSAGVLLGVLVLPALVGCDEVPPPDRSPTAIAFTDCASRVPGVAGLEVDCGTLDVPLDHADPGGATLALQVIRVRSDAQHDRIGSLLVNPGGPGESGVAYAAYLATALPAPLLERFDLVGFDPRGVGSRPR